MRPNGAQLGGEIQRNLNGVVFVSFSLFTTGLKDLLRYVITGITAFYASRALN